MKFKMDSIVVSANRIPTLTTNVGRNIGIISNYDIEFLPSLDVQGLLDNRSGIDVKERGPEGVQADISIRGGSFEQTLILIDGIRLSDPQTGHHNMNLPISISQIERIEIIKGQGSRIHGANAFSGVINIIPKNGDLNSLSIDASGGENSYFKLGIGGSYKLGNTSHNISFSRSRSDGYRSNTEFENYSVSMNNSYKLSNSVIKTIFGYTSKDFGANSYYTIRFPDQAEKTKTLLAAATAELKLQDFTLFPKVYWRNNRDEFVLFKNNPSFYKNNHETDVYGGELQASTNVLGGAT
ncbi:MAG: TonB-dependent receptor plug domain-containing protein, partial [Melioribacteraceae bacterium]|nr:TonB-dependent receptor plug domain-containing protein [Melioribacteraceae bacterium]